MKVLKINPGSLYWEEFLSLPEILDKTNIYGENYIAQKKNSINQEFSNDNLFWNHGEAACFVAIDGAENSNTEKVVGRIVSSINHNLSDKNLGYIGYFECINSFEVATQLFKAAQEWLQGKEIKKIQGPVNLDIYTQYRLQMSGFEKPAYLGEPRALPYYQELFKANGYEVLSTWTTFALNRALMTFIHQQKTTQSQSINRQNADHETWKISTMTSENFISDLKILHPMIMEIFSENYGYVFLDQAEFLNHFIPLKNLLRPDFFLNAFDHKNPVAFAYTYICPQTNSAILSTFGVKKTHRKTTIAYNFIQQTIDLVLKNPSIETAYMSLCKEGKTFADGLTPADRTYAIWQKEL